MMKNIEGYLGIVMIIIGISLLIFYKDGFGIIGIACGMIALSSWEMKDKDALKGHDDLTRV